GERLRLQRHPLAVSDQEGLGAAAERGQLLPEGVEQLAEVVAPELGVDLRPEELDQRLARGRAAASARQVSEQVTGLLAREARELALPPGSAKPAQELDPPARLHVRMV